MAGPPGEMGGTEWVNIRCGSARSAPRFPRVPAGAREQPDELHRRLVLESPRTFRGQKSGLVSDWSWGHAPIRGRPRKCGPGPHILGRTGAAWRAAMRQDMHSRRHPVHLSLWAPDNHGRRWFSAMARGLIMAGVKQVSASRVLSASAHAMSKRAIPPSDAQTHRPSH
jgi:hypothetical protein